MTESSPPHVLLLPYPSSGHVIPLLNLTRRLLTRGLTITLLVTPPSLSLFHSILSSSPPSLQTLILSPPTPSSPSLASEIRALHALYHPILSWFESHPSPPTAIISDVFLGWTHRLAAELGVPRVVFSPSGAFGTAVYYSLWGDAPENGDPSGDWGFEVGFGKIPSSPSYKWWEISHVYRNGKRGDPDWEFFREGMLSNMASWGTVLNSFTELEGTHIDFLKKEMGHDRVWAVGPLLSLDEESIGPAQRGGLASGPAQQVLTWLDGRPDGSVLYVCFGSRTSLTEKQAAVLGAALECSGVHFVWCVREGDECHVDTSYEDRVAGRGFIVKGWAPQVEILCHRAVAAFLTHCGWNSVVEAVTAAVVMVAWPMGADQFSDAQLVVDQLGVAMRVQCDGPENVPDSEELGRVLSESVNKGGPKRERVVQLRKAALEAGKDGGSSGRDLDELVKCLSEVAK